MTDEERKIIEERIKIRDSLDDDARRKIFEAAHQRRIARQMSGGGTERENALEARLERIEQRLETLETKK
jgi:hypothetical protein